MGIPGPVDAKIRGLSHYHHPHKKRKESMLIIGCGYMGQRVIAQLADPASVTGVVRSAASAAAIEALGAHALRADLDQDSLAPLPSRGTQVLYLAPPPSSGTCDTRMTRFLAATNRDGEPLRIVYISTSGVYGDCGGQWVDESWPANPGVDRARRRWDAEQQLRAWRARSGGELVILRVAGIYGPGKLPLARLKKGLPMIAAHETPWTNRIHADDLATALLAALERGRDGEVYNACDGHPGNMADYFNRVADLAGLPRPPVIPVAEAGSQLSAGLQSYLAESRRLSNRKLVDELGVVLRYRSLDEGLPACFAGD
jgi:nucleoside-diphosphate-sugar epimerase